MAKRAKTRFCANVILDNRELFSVTCGGDGDLRFLPMPQHGLIDRASRKIERESHISIHKTNSGSDTTITYFQKFVDGSTKKNACLILDTNERLLAPVFFAQPGSLAPSELLPRPKDNIIKIGECSGLLDAMFYGVFVTNAEGDLNITNDSFNFFYANFGYFKLLIFVSYVNIPSISSSSTAFFPTSSVVENGIFAENHVQNPIYSLSGQEMFEIYYKTINKMRDDLITRNLKSDYETAKLTNFCLLNLSGRKFSNKCAAKFIPKSN